MTQIDIGLGKLFRQNLGDAVRGRPVIDHFCFRPDTRVLRAEVVAFRSGHTFSVLLTAPGHMNSVVAVPPDGGSITTVQVPV